MRPDLVETGIAAENILDIVRESLVVLDEELYVTTANSAFFRTFDMSPHETIHRRIYELCDGQWNIPRLRELLETIIPERTAIENFEVTHEFHRLGKRTMIINGRKIQREPDRSPLIILAVDDITAQETTRRELEETSGTLETLLDSIPEGIMVTDERHVVRQAGRYLEELLGVPPTKILHTDESGRLDLLDLRWLDGRKIDRPEELPISMAVVTGKRYTDVEMTLTRDGSSRVVSVNAAPIVDSEGKIVGAAGGWRDVTDRKRSENALRESEERFRTLADNISQLVWMAEPDGNIFWYNKRWFEYTGKSPSDMQQEGWKSVPHPDHLETLEKSYLQAIQAGRPWEMTFPMRNRWGEYRWFLTRAMPIHDSYGSIVRWFGTNTDINDRKELEDELSRRAGELDAVNRDLESFSYSVSHDLRNPLHVISSFADILKDEYSHLLDEEGREFLRRIDESADKMRELIDNLLALSRIGREHLHRENVNLSRIVEDFLHELMFSQPNRKIETVVQPDVRAYADPRLVSPALENLLRNAWKFTSGRDTARIEFGITAYQGQTVYYVRDNGIGFDMRFADIIFEPFKRIHEQKEYGGTGIGLSIVRRVIDRHQGLIWAEGDVGTGAVFYFTLDSEK